MRYRIVILIGVVLGGCSERVSAAESQATKTLRKREALVRKVCRELTPTVVTVNRSSGVIISKDGLVLSQYHVSHKRRRGSYKEAVAPGHDVKIVFADGRQSVARTLGADRVYDISLLKLKGNGPFPYARLDPQNRVTLGDWVIKFGHPSGSQAGRPPVVRLGRVVGQVHGQFITDCAINGGDSGGPFFDLSGRLVGLIRHGGIARTSLPQNMQTRTRSRWFVTSIPVIHARRPLMLRGDVTAARHLRMHRVYRDLQRLDVDRYTQGRRQRRQWRDVWTKASRSVVKIAQGTCQVAFGTVVSRDGLIVTKASVLPPKPKCVLANGDIVPARVVGRDPAFDFAVLRVDRKLCPVEWSKETSAPIGSFVTVPADDVDPFVVGVVSVARRKMPGRFPNRVTPAVRRRADPPEIGGITVMGRGLIVVSVDGNAARAGLLPGDVVRAVGGVATNAPADLLRVVADRREGDCVYASVRRKGKDRRLLIRLDHRKSPKRTLSYRMPVMFEHDAPLTDFEFGGPVIDLNGQALGVSLGHVSGYGCAAIPADVVRRMVEQHASSDRRGRARIDR